MKLENKLRSIKGARLKTIYGSATLWQYYPDKKRVGVIHDKGVEYKVKNGGFEFVYVGDGDTISFLSRDDIIG